MQRRTLILSLGTAVGGGTLVGSSAFTSVEASRDVAVSVADDANALLAFNVKREQYIGDRNDGRLVISLGAPTTNEGGEGFNDNALTNVDNIIGIENQGTQPTGVGFVDDNGTLSQETTVGLTNPDTASGEVTLSLSDDADEIKPGDEEQLSAEVDTRKDPTDPPAETAVTIGADAETDLNYGGSGDSGGGI